jgi:tRNA(Ile)-lysidine synthase
MGWLDRDRLSGSLELRSWQPGDRYHPHGTSGEEKLKDLFQQARVPRWERTRWPVLTDDSGIVWTRRFGSAARCAAGPDTRVALRVRVIESESRAAASIT